MIALMVMLAALAAEPDPHLEVRGVTVSCPTSGQEWASDEMVETLRELAALGVNWVAIHPYARIEGDGTVGFRPSEDPPAWIARPIREAHALGIKVMIKPHLAYWGSPFRWRGEIEFRDPVDRARFFETYTAWITQVARHSAGADAFVVGTELDATLADEASWRSVIASVRTAYDGHLTYAANWDRVEAVPFWDAVDTIGVQAYFPLVTRESPGAVPSDAELDAGWSRWLARLRRLSAATGKPVVFTEVGYDRSPWAALEPWRPAPDPAAEPLQLAALRSAMRAMDSEPVVVGGFLWKWFPGARMPRDFAMQAPGPRAVIAESWGSGR